MITIFMPVYNGIEFINESVESVMIQTVDCWELIIGVNGHEKNSTVYKIAKKHEETNPKIKVLDLYSIKGKSEALNEMIQFAKYDYIALLDVDDVWHPTKLETQLPFINNYDVVGTRCMYFGENTHLNGVTPQIPHGDISNRNFFEFNPIINSSSVIKKIHCKWNGEFDGVEDYDLWLSLRKQNKTFYNCQEILVKHRIHNKSAFNSKGNGNRVPELLQKYSQSKIV